MELIGQSFHRASKAIAFVPKRSDDIKIAVIGMEVSDQLLRHRIGMKAPRVSRRSSFRWRMGKFCNDFRTHLKETA
jgi:hypothetical protein